MSAALRACHGCGGALRRQVRPPGAVAPACQPDDTMCVPARSAGFTLIELMLVITICGALVMFAANSFGAYLQRQRVIATSNEFFHALGLARAEAMQRGGRVVLAPLQRGDWNGGWQVFAKGPGNTRTELESGDQALLMHARPPADVRIATNMVNAAIAYNGAGRAFNGATGAGFFGSLQFAAGADVRLIRIAQLGRARLCNPDSDSTCIFSGAAAIAEQQ